jgi:hypothetical protein
MTGQSEMDGEEQKRLALDHILGAWEAALEKGVSSDLLASTAIFAALADMVALHGPEPVAAMVRTLPDRITAGEFSLDGGEQA